MKEIKFKQGRKNIHGGMNWEYFTLKSGVVFDVFLYGDTPILQYTGLKDKNEKEIYEGDIVTGKIAIGTHEIIDVKGEVKYNEKQAMYCILSFNHMLPLSACRLDDTLEVIGNIYENKELLQ